MNSIQKEYARLIQPENIKDYVTYMYVLGFGSALIGYLAAASNYYIQGILFFIFFFFDEKLADKLIPHSKYSLTAIRGIFYLPMMAGAYTFLFSFDEKQLDLGGETLKITAYIYGTSFILAICLHYVTKRKKSKKAL